MVSLNKPPQIDEYAEHQIVKGEQDKRSQIKSDKMTPYDIIELIAIIIFVMAGLIGLFGLSLFCL